MDGHSLPVLGDDINLPDVKKQKLDFSSPDSGLQNLTNFLQNFQDSQLKDYSLNITDNELSNSPSPANVVPNQCTHSVVNDDVLFEMNAYQKGYITKYKEKITDFLSKTENRKYLVPEKAPDGCYVNKFCHCFYKDQETGTVKYVRAKLPRGQRGNKEIVSFCNLCYVESGLIKIVFRSVEGRMVRDHLANHSGNKKQRAGPHLNVELANSVNTGWVFQIVITCNYRFISNSSIVKNIHIENLHPVFRTSNRMVPICP